jgi:starch phosphorylase
VTAIREEDRWRFTVEVDLGPIAAAMVRVELYADAVGAAPACCEIMQPEDATPEAAGHHVYRGSVPASRPSWHFTPRIVPHHPEARIPIEAPLILWPR